MGINQNRQFSSGEEVTSTKMNDIIGSATISGLLNSNFSSAAAIADSKLAQIISNDKVNFSALVAGSQATGDLLYSSAGAGLARFPIGTNTQKLRVGHDSYTKLMLHCNGTDGATTFTDDNITAKTVTNTASFDTYSKTCSHFDGADEATAYTDPIAGAYTFQGTAQLDTAQFKFGTASLLLDGNSDYVTLPDSANWNFGTGAFTIDCWVRFPSLGGYHIICSQMEDLGGGNFRHWIFEHTPTTLKISHSQTGTVDINYTAPFVHAVDTWYHIEIGKVASANTYYFFVDGTLLTTTEVTAGGTFTDVASVLYVGSDTSTFFNGWIDELRISKGVLRHSASFTVPAYPYGQVITSTTSPKFGTASAYFDGGGSQLSLADSADWNFGTGSFTIDFWIKFSILPTDQTAIWEQYVDATHYIKLYLHYTAGWVIVVYDGSQTVNIQQGAVTTSAGTWYHIALVRNGNDWNIYQNGTSVASGTDDSEVPDFAAVVKIGDGQGVNHFNGYIDEFRVSKGVARWTANFTPETSAYSPSLIWVTP
jgi:hypothetical protein